MAIRGLAGRRRSQWGEGGGKLIKKEKSTLCYASAASPPPPKKSQKVDNEIGSSTYETRKREKARAKYMDILAQTATWQMEKKNKLFFVCLK